MDLRRDSTQGQPPPAILGRLPNTFVRFAEGVFGWARRCQCHGGIPRSSSTPMPTGNPRRLAWAGGPETAGRTAGARPAAETSDAGVPVEGGGVRCPRDLPPGIQQPTGRPRPLPVSCSLASSDEVGVSIRAAGKVCRKLPGRRRPRGPLKLMPQLRADHALDRPVRDRSWAAYREEPNRAGPPHDVGWSPDQFARPADQDRG